MEIIDAKIDIIYCSVIVLNIFNNRGETFISHKI